MDEMEQENVNKLSRKIQGNISRSSQLLNWSSESPDNFSNNNDRENITIKECDVKEEKNTYHHKEQPKKRWLREASKDQALWHDLAQPINWPDPQCENENPPQRENLPKRENLIRPTVLIMAGTTNDIEKSTTPDEELSSKWLGAMALIQLSKESDGSPLNLSQPRYTEL